MFDRGNVEANRVDKNIKSMKFTRNTPFMLIYRNEE